MASTKDENHFSTQKVLPTLDICTNNRITRVWIFWSILTQMGQKIEGISLTDENQKIWLGKNLAGHNFLARNCQIKGRIKYSKLHLFEQIFWQIGPSNCHFSNLLKLNFSLFHHQYLFKKLWKFHCWKILFFVGCQYYLNKFINSIQTHFLIFCQTYFSLFIFLKSIHFNLDHWDDFPVHLFSIFNFKLRKWPRWNFQFGNK